MTLAFLTLFNFTNYRFADGKMTSETVLLAVTNDDLLGFNFFRSGSDFNPLTLLFFDAPPFASFCVVPIARFCVMFKFDLII